MRRGVVYGLSFDGLGYLKDCDSGALFTFTLDVVEGYHGQRLEDFAVKNGSIVEYRSVGTVVEYVAGAAAAKRAKATAKAIARAI